MKTSTFLPLALLSLCANTAHAFEVTSTDIKNGERMAEKHVFNGFGCSGGNVSPQLSWKDAPVGTKSFAVTAYDPDAPTGSGWWHWVIVNIPANVTSLDSGAGNGKSRKLPKGALQTRTDFAQTGYGGPCPPVGHGDHHYKFTVYALKEKLKVKADMPAAMVGYNIIGNELDRATIESTYSREAAAPASADKSTSTPTEGEAH